MVYDNIVIIRQDYIKESTKTHYSSERDSRKMCKIERVEGEE
jgi:hypothetical protein